MLEPSLVAHADWSTTLAGRAWAVAKRSADGTYHVTMPFMPEGSTLLTKVAAEAGCAPALVGFDFPIGLPTAFADRSKAPSFKAWLAEIDEQNWERFRQPARTADQIEPGRPFYPFKPGGAKLKHLLDGHGVSELAPLLRRCERGTTYRPPASCLFWTLDAKQCGRAALAGWHEVIRPALRHGKPRIAVWPFDGELGRLIDQKRLIVAETYPADAYHQIGLQPPVLKSSRLGRRKHADRIEASGRELRVALDENLRQAVHDGFGDARSGQDRFDALVGLLAMILVVRGRRAAGAPTDHAVRNVEGWILGLDPMSLHPP